MKRMIRFGVVFICETREFTWSNYEFIFKEATIFHATLISVLRTVTGTVTSVFCCAMVAYTISRVGVCAAQICLDCFYFDDVF